MDRFDKITHLQNLIIQVEGVFVKTEYFKDYEEEKIDKDIEFYEYVLDK